MNHIVLVGISTMEHFPGFLPQLFIVLCGKSIQFVFELLLLDRSIIVLIKFFYDLLGKLLGGFTFFKFDVPSNRPPEFSRVNNIVVVGISITEHFPGFLLLHFIVLLGKFLDGFFELPLLDRIISVLIECSHDLIGKLLGG